MHDTNQQWKNTKLNEKFNELLNCMMKIPDRTSLQIKKETLHYCALIILTIRFLTLFYRFPIFNTVEDEIYPLNLDNNPNPHIAIAKVVKKCEEPCELLTFTHRPPLDGSQSIEVDKLSPK